MKLFKMMILAVGCLVLAAPLAADSGSDECIGDDPDSDKAIRAGASCTGVPMQKNPCYRLYFNQGRKQLVEEIQSNQISDATTQEAYDRVSSQIDPLD